MNKTIAVLVFVIAVRPCFSVDLFGTYFGRNIEKQQVKVRDVEGLDERIAGGKLRLHLREFLILVLRNSAEIQMTRMDIYAAANRIIGAKSPFDPALGLAFNASRSLTPPFYYSQATLSNLSQQSNVGFTQLLPSGQTIASNLAVSRYSGANYTAPALFGNLSFSVTQPLLRNRTNIEFRSPLKIARSQLNITSQISEAAIGLSISEAARQYWLAVLARDSIGVQEQTLALAQKAYERDKKALDLGAIAKLDIFQSETQVAERTRDLIQARFQYTAALDGLRRLIGADLTPALRATEIVLEDDASALKADAEVKPFEQALAAALLARPEMQAVEGRISVDDLTAKAARETLLPRLDLTLNGGASGPSANFGTAGVVYPGLTETLRQVLGFNYPTYGLGLQMTLPFRNSSGQANLADALVSKTRNVYQRRQTQEQIILDVRQAINAIELAKATIDAATKARDLARQNVDAERQKYELGTITAFEYLDSQTRLAATENSLLSSFVAYQQAYVNYQRATWTLLDGLGMVVENPNVH